MFLSEEGKEIEKGVFKMEERRYAPRWPLETTFFYEVSGEEKGRISRGLLQDINLVAAKVYLKTQLPTQSKIRFAFKIPNQLTYITTEAEVLWQSSSIAMGFPTGIRFTIFRLSDKERIMEHFEKEIRQNWWREELAGETDY